MKKLLSISTELNALIRVDAMHKGTTANAIIIELLEREYMNGKPPKVEPLKVAPVKEAPEQKTVDRKPRTEAHLRKGEPTIEHIEAAMFLQRKQHPKGILHNGECFRASTDKGFKYAYFAEDLKKYLKEEPF
jgi:hypothetical protein